MTSTMISERLQYLLTGLKVSGLLFLFYSYTSLNSSLVAEGCRYAVKSVFTGGMS